MSRRDTYHAVWVDEDVAECPSGDEADHMGGEALEEHLGRILAYDKSQRMFQT